MASLLSAESHEVLGFDSSQTAFDEIADSRPDALVIDLRAAAQQSGRGQLDGFEFVALARADPRLRHVPIIVCTADQTAVRDGAEELRRSGGVYVLQKPFETGQMLDVLDRALDPVTSGTSGGGRSQRGGD